MIFQPTTLVHVYFMGGNEKRLMGRLLLKDRKIFFEYAADFLQTGLQVSPFKLPLKNGVIAPDDRTFDGLFGVFNDSLPDGWGRLLLDRKLLSAGFNPGMLSPLDRLCYVGANGMGALAYEPENPSGSRFPHNDFDEIADEIKHFQETEDDRFIDDLLIWGGSSAGARPKIVTSYEDEQWLIKFRSNIDPSDIGNIEYAYHLMAVTAGLDVPDAKLFPSRKGNGYFGVKRFDRKEGKRIHMHTISGLLHADHREPSLDYENIMKTTLWLTRDVRECEKQFKNAVFNVLSHNRDDHAKNFSYLLNESGIWVVSPAYDLTFSSGPGGEHSSLVVGEGRNPTTKHLLQLAAIGNIKKPRALEIIEEVSCVTAKWVEFSDAAGVGKSSRTMIQVALDAIRKRFF